MLLTPFTPSSPVHIPVNIPGAHSLPSPYQHRESLKVSTGRDISTLAAGWVGDWDGWDPLGDRAKIDSHLSAETTGMYEKISLQKSASKKWLVRDMYRKMCRFVPLASVQMARKQSAALTAIGGMPMCTICPQRGLGTGRGESM